MKRILYLTPIFLPHIGGIEKYVDSLATYFTGKGNKVTVVTADANIKNIVLLNSFSYKVIRVPVKSFAGILVASKKIKKLIKTLLAESDIVHSNDCKFLYSFLVKNKKKYNYKLLLSSHGFVFHTSNNMFIKKIFFKHVVACKSKYFDKIICVSSQDAEIANKYNIRNTITIIPGTDLYKFKSDNIVDIEKNSFLYWGRIAPNKGILECLKKIELMKNAKFTFIGRCDDENYKKEIDDYIVEKKMQNIVNFIGMKTDSEIKDYIAKCEFIIIPSLHEGFGMTLVEALGTGKKIIANKIPSFMKILDTCNANEYLFDFQNLDTNLADKVEELRKENVNVKNLEKYSTQTMYKDIEVLYQL